MSGAFMDVGRLPGWLNRAAIPLAGLCLVACLVSQSHASAPPFATVPDEIIDRGWRPPVSLAGQGDPQVAVTRMRDYAALRETLINHTHYHAEARDFASALRASLERFDLRGFYELLPDESGDYRQWRLEGVMEDGRYSVRPVRLQGRRALANHVNRPLPMGDVQARVRAREIASRRTRHYLLEGDVRLGLGVMTWPAVLQASQDTLRLMVEPEPDFDTGPDEGYYRSRVQQMNTQLSREEVDVLAPLWAAYPSIWDLVSELGEIEQLLVRGGADETAQRVEAVVRAMPERLNRQYPALRRFLDRLGPIMALEAVLYDEHGELGAVTLDSEAQRASLSLLVRDGQPVPTRHGEAVPEGRPLLEPEPRRMTVDVTMRVELLGIIVDITGMQGYINYQPEDDEARIRLQMVHTPAVRSRGRALGVMPAGVINFVLPRSIDQLATDFLSVATQGNDGEGISGAVSFRQNRAGEAELAVDGAFEALDNFMVRLGMRMVSDRIIPDATTADELAALISAIQAAFVEDLGSFEARVARLE